MRMRSKLVTAFRFTLFIGIALFLGVICAFSKQAYEFEIASAYDQRNKSSSDNISSTTITATTSFMKTSSQKPQSNGIKSIIILAYQRSGSTFLGSLFNWDHRIFYMFEPLDALYSSLYGTEPGWNVPSDIVTYSNGTERSMTHSEMAGITTYLGRLLTCDIDNLPTELLVHKFWKDWKHEHRSLYSYSQCLEGNTHIMENIDSLIHAQCGRRYGDQPPDRMLLCNRLLNDVQFRKTYSDRRLAAEFSRYRDKIDRLVRFMVNDGCVPILKSACESRSVRAVKLVRATMETMEPLLSRFPDSFVIHLVRDPRAVALSRRNYHSSTRAAFSESAFSSSERLVREASIYCRQVAADVRWRRHLEQKFPGRLYSLTYEQLVDSPASRAGDIYRFIGETPTPMALDKFVGLSTVDAQTTAKERAMKWLRGALTETEFQQIGSNCKEMMQLYPEYAGMVPETFSRPVHYSQPRNHWFLRSGRFDTVPQHIA